VGARSCHQPSLTTLDEAVEAAIAGAGYKAVEQLTGVPHSTVRYHVIQRGIARRWPAPRGPGHDQQRLLVTPAPGSVA